MTRLAPIALLLFALGGCTTVHVPQPLGDAPASLDPADWNGTWCDPSTMAPAGNATLSADGADCMTLTVVDGGAGIIDVTATGEPDDRSRAHLRSVGEHTGWILVSIEGQGGYEFVLLLRRRGHTVVAWSVDGDAIGHAVEAGRLAGRAEEDHVFLEPLDRPALERLLGDDGRTFFTWRDPGLLIRVSGGS